MKGRRGGTEGWRSFAFRELVESRIPGTHFKIKFVGRWRSHDSPTGKERLGEVLVRAALRSVAEPAARQYFPGDSVKKLSDELTLSCQSVDFTRGGFQMRVTSAAQAKLAWRSRRSASQIASLRRKDRLRLEHKLSEAEAISSILSNPATVYSWFAQNSPDTLTNSEKMSEIGNLCKLVAASKPTVSGSNASLLASTAIQFIAHLGTRQQDRLIEVLPQLLRMFDLESVARTFETSAVLNNADIE